MANASKTHMGQGPTGKRAGTGALTDDSIVEGRLEENMVLSNRDKSLHSPERGLDGKSVQSEQFQDHSANRQRDAATDAVPGGNTSGQSASRSGQSDDESGLAKRGA